MAKKLSIEDPKKKKPNCRDARLDFSSTNFEKTTHQWLGAIKKKEDSLPAIYQQALAATSARRPDDHVDSDSENDCADIDSEPELKSGPVDVVDQNP